MGKKFLLSTALTILLFANPLQEDFSNVKIGSIPFEWTVSATNKKSPGLWEVDKNRSLRLINPRGYLKNQFNIFYTNRYFFSEGSFQADIKPTKGKKIAGILWHLRDKNNYMFALIDFQKGNLSINEIKDGNIKTLHETKIDLNRDFNQLKAKFNKEFSTIYLNGKKIATVKNSIKKGGVGVISAADTKGVFDNFVIEISKNSDKDQL